MAGLGAGVAPWMAISRLNSTESRYVRIILEECEASVFLLSLLSLLVSCFLNVELKFSANYNDVAMLTVDLWGLSLHRYRTRF
jgi:hypothetical protein